MKAKNKALLWVRWGILSVILGFITYSAYLHQTLGGEKAASIHALCPFGGLESLYMFFQTGSFISKIYTGTMILFFITFILAILFRRSFCGLICPFGTIQEIFGKIGQKLFKKNLVMPVSIDKVLRYLKYVVLLITVVYAWYTAGLWMAPYDPWSVYAHIAEGFDSIWAELPVGFILLIVTVIGSIMYDRFFCKYLCPMGALYGIIGKFSPFKVVRNENECVNCGMCSKVCPVNIEVDKLKYVTSAECLNCQICVLKCPKDGALENKFSKKTITPLIAILLVLGVFFIPVWISKTADVFQTTQEAPEAGEIIELSEVRGYMTIKTATEYSGVSIDEFYKLFKIPENIPDGTKLKELSKLIPDYNFDKMKHELEEAGKFEGDNESGEEAKTTEVNQYKGKIDPYKVKGSMTIRAGSFVVETELDEFYKIFKIPETVPDTTKMKEISNNIEDYDFEGTKASLE